MKYYKFSARSLYGSTSRVSLGFPQEVAQGISLDIMGIHLGNLRRVFFILFFPRAVLGTPLRVAQLIPS